MDAENGVRVGVRAILAILEAFDGVRRMLGGEVDIVSANSE